MTDVRRRIATLCRRLQPAGLVWRWHVVLAHIAQRWELGWDAEEIARQAHQAAATGEDPGTVLARELARLAGAWAAEHEGGAPEAQERPVPEPDAGARGSRSMCSSTGGTGPPRPEPDPDAGARG
jgi:hypothetical protein